MDEPILVGCDEQRVHAAHVVDGHRDVGLADLVELVGGCPDPKLDSGVPAARYDNRGVTLGVNKTGYILDRLGVLADR